MEMKNRQTIDLTTRWGQFYWDYGIYKGYIIIIISNNSTSELFKLNCDEIEKIPDYCEKRDTILELYFELCQLCRSILTSFVEEYHKGVVIEALHNLRFNRQRDVFSSDF